MGPPISLMNTATGTPPTTPDAATAVVKAVILSLQEQLAEGKKLPQQEDEQVLTELLALEGIKYSAGLQLTSDQMKELASDYITLTEEQKKALELSQQEQQQREQWNERLKTYVAGEKNFEDQVLEAYQNRLSPTDEEQKALDKALASQRQRQQESTQILAEQIAGYACRRLGQSNHH